MATCWHCKTETPAAHYARVVENKTALYADWEGWRMSGRFLIAPGKVGRIMPGRLLGLLWREAAENRMRFNDLKDRARSSQGILLPARELFRGQA